MNIQPLSSGQEELENALSQLRISDNKQHPFVTTMLGTLSEKTITDEPSLYKLFTTTNLLCGIVVNTIKQIESKNFIQFDPLVSECQCHIRALMIHKIVHDIFNNTNSSLLQEIATLKKLKTTKQFLHKESLRIQKSLSLRYIQKPPFTPKNAIAALPEELQTLSISTEMLTLILSHMLTITKQTMRKAEKCNLCNEYVKNTQDSTNIQLLNSLQKNLDETWVNAIVCQAKQILSEISSACIQAIDSPYKLMSAPKNLLQDKREYKGSAYTLSMLPFFVTVAHVFTEAVCKNIPILIKSRLQQHSVTDEKTPFDTTIVFQGKTIVPLSACHNEVLQSVAIIVEGQRTQEKETQEEYQKRLLSHDFLDIVHMNAAHHRQYAGSHEHTTPPIQDKRVHVYAQRAEEKGCCLTNQSLFCITHMFCDTISNQMKKGNTK